MSVQLVCSGTFGLSCKERPGVRHRKERVGVPVQRESAASAVNGVVSREVEVVAGD